MPNFGTLSKYGRSSDIGMYKVSVKHVKSHTFVEEDKLNNNYLCHIQLIIFKMSWFSAKNQKKGLKVWNLLFQVTIELGIQMNKLILIYWTKLQNGFFNFTTMSFISYCLRPDLFKEYLKLLNRLYDITWFGSVYA